MKIRNCWPSVAHLQSVALYPAGVQHYNEIKGISICEFLPPHLSIYLDKPAEEVQKKLKQSGKVDQYWNIVSGRQVIMLWLLTPNAFLQPEQKKTLQTWRCEFVKWAEGFCWNYSDETSLLLAFPAERFPDILEGHWGFLQEVFLASDQVCIWTYNSCKKSENSDIKSETTQKKIWAFFSLSLSQWDVRGLSLWCDPGPGHWKGERSCYLWKIP